MSVKFLFMDEKYADSALPPAMRVTSLTGVLVNPEAHAAFRAQFYSLLNGVRGDPENTISALTTIHAAELFPEYGTDDSRRIEFVKGLMKLMVANQIRIFRVGYVWSPKMREVFKTEKAVLGICFDAILRVLTNELRTNQIWPVMETDRSSTQDQTFAGSVRNLDYLTTRLSAASISFDNSNLGEVLFSTKNSTYGTVVDFAAYLLHLRFLKTQGLMLTPFKEQLAAMAVPLDEITERNETIEMQISRADG
ncbi:hypothetical protein ACO2JO_11630 [Leptospira interrogans]